jgi:lipid A 3-O-deacylase
MAIGLCSIVQAGLIITAENDALFDQSDENYSHGTEIEYVTWKYDGFTPYRVGYGVNQLMFTPQNIKDPNMPPMTDRPWCGTLNFYYETWERTHREEINTRYSVGVMGPYSGSEESQKIIHRGLGCNPPKGWDNQMPNEPMLNLYHDRYRLIWSQPLFDEFSADFKLVYGGTIGTTYLNARGGAQARIGYNIPINSLPGSIVPKVTREGKLQFTNQRLFIYLIGGVQEMYVPFNATIGGSIFKNREAGQERPLEEFVYIYRYGLVTGIKNMSVTYILEERQEEFEGETDGGLGFGMLRLEFTYQF